MIYDGWCESYIYSRVCHVICPPCGVATTQVLQHFQQHVNSPDDCIRKLLSVVHKRRWSEYQEKRMSEPTPTSPIES